METCRRIQLSLSARAGRDEDSWKSQGMLGLLLLGGGVGLGVVLGQRVWQRYKEQQKRPPVMLPPEGFEDQFRHPYKVQDFTAAFLVCY